jgi:membrane protease YdiL (CAAX protease family)
MRGFATSVGVLACFFGALAVPFIRRYHLGPPAVVGIYGCFLLSIILLLAPGVEAPRHWIQARLVGNRRLAWLPVIWCLPYLVYAAGTGDIRWLALARLFGIGVVLVLIYRLFPVRDLARFDWQDLVVASVLTFALMRQQLVGIWNVPANLDFMGRLFLICIACWSWMFVRPVPGLGYEFALSWRSAGIAGWNFVLFGLIAIPAGLAIGFIRWNPLRTGLPGFVVSFIEIFLFIALLEELFFRGFLQTLISENLHSARLGQILISCLFGLFHILHAPVPNWRYVILASVAGWFYGSAFVKSGTLMTSAMTHAMVDAVWRAFFSKS